jgi:hypothetical protein
MARPSFLSRLRRPDTAPPPGPAPEGAPAVPTPPRRPLPPPGRLRRERRALVRERDDRIRDLGGLVLEMYRRDSFRDDVVYERCAELLGLEERLRELDTLLTAAERTRHPAPAARCECGAPIFWGSRFCATCGRPVAQEAATTCARCGAPVPAGMSYCGACGTPVEVELPQAPPELAGPEPNQ